MPQSNCLKKKKKKKSCVTNTRGWDETFLRVIQPIEC